MNDNYERLEECDSLIEDLYEQLRELNYLKDNGFLDEEESYDEEIFSLQSQIQEIKDLKFEILSEEPTLEELRFNTPTNSCVIQ